jgi:hypothetical protein
LPIGKAAHSIHCFTAQFVRRTAEGIANWQRLTGRCFHRETVTAGNGPIDGAGAIGAKTSTILPEIAANTGLEQYRFLSSTQASHV